MRLYAFDEVSEELERLPLSARRALDAVGRKLSLVQWKKLALAERRTLATLGSATAVDLEAVEHCIAEAFPAAEPVPRLVDPDPLAVPALVRSALGSRPLADNVWSALSPLDRYALNKVAYRGRAARVAGAYDEIVGSSADSSHLTARGEMRMIDVSAKPTTARRAVAETRVLMNAEAFSRLEQANAPKGDVLGAARLAGIMAAKRTSELIPLCHPLALTKVEVSHALEAGGQLTLLATVETVDRTGVEMEALMAVSVAALTVYDMLKAFDRKMQIGPTRLVEKSGGRSGPIVRGESFENE